MATRGRSDHRLRAGQRLGKYRIARRIASGGFADVYRAYDTVEGIHVAIKVPHPLLVADRALDDFVKEVRITARLDHPNILHLKYAGHVDDRFVIVYPLGVGTLRERMRSRLSVRQVMDFTAQMLEAVAFAHRKRVIHCDIKPDNFILFADGRLKLGDFGIAKLASRYTLSASGSGTVGYVAPEQAMGRPSLRSDVFSLGLIAWRMLAGELPAWPFDWPLPGTDRVRRKTHPDFVAFLRRALEVDARRRYPSAVQMLEAFRRVRPRVVQKVARRRRRRTTNGSVDWRDVLQREFRRQYGRMLETRFACTRCGGPVSEAMHACPWCGHAPRTFRHQTRYPARCRHCRRGMKLDWRFCPHCYSPAQGPRSARSYSDVRYRAACHACRGPLMPFMRYCPWCHRKVRRRWTIEGVRPRCPRCGWSVLRDYWSTCPWCRASLGRR